MNQNPLRPHARAVALLLLLTLGAGLSCGDPATAPSVPPPPPSPRATTVAVTPAAASVTAGGDTVRLTAEVRDQRGQPMAGAAVAWSSGNAAVATVNASGLVAGVAAGEVEITATSSGVAGRAAVTVVAQAPTMVAVTPDTVTLTALGQTKRISAEVRDQAGRPMEGAPVSWSSADMTVATVDSAGLATATGDGTTTIIATAGDAAGEAAVIVRRSAGSVAVTPSTATVAPGDTLRLAAAAYDENGHAIAGAEFAWSSSDAAVATVDGSGLVTGGAEGAATITAAAGDARGTAKITVANPDRAALVALYNATDGPNWVNSGNWLTDAPLGQWHGVQINNSGRVHVLNLRENRLTGPIPPELGNLTALDHMELSRNQLTGPIPPELGNLTGLVNLLLWGNALTGPIPLELTSLSRLKTLSLSRNRLAGPIPPEIGNLDGLETLVLSTNQLTGAIPPELGNLRNLASLQLFNNGLTGTIPHTFGSLGRLIRLLLDGNRLTGAIPPELGNVRSLEMLRLSQNQLTGPIPTELGNLSSLTELLLHRNRLTGPIPPELGNLSALESLTLDDNRLVGAVPPVLGNLTALRFLRLSGNVDLFGPLPRSLINLGQLRNFPFGGTDLCAPGDPVFQNWLEGVGEWGGKICDDAGFGHRQALMAVYESAEGANWAVSANWGSDRPLNEWHGVRADTADRVVELDLSGNALAGALAPDIGSLETLKRLRLDSNPDLAGDLPRAMVRLPVLEELGIEGTGLCIPPSPLFLDWLDGVGSVRGPRCRDDYGHDRETAAEAPLGGIVSGELDYATDEDLFGVNVPREGTLSLRASGDARTRLELEDGDNLFWGEGLSPWGITRRIPRGKYYIRVSGETPNTTGTYALELSFEPLAPPARAYLTQAVQSHDGAVPLVAGEDALLRVFVTRPEGTDATMPPVRATFHAGGAVARVVDIPAGSAPVPPEVRENDLEATANAVIPGSVLAPGLEMVVEIDPEGTLDPALGIGGRIPKEGRLALDVRRVPNFHVTAVPLLYAQDPDSSGFRATVGLTAAHEVFYETREWLPVANMEVAVREPLHVDYDPREDMPRALDDIALLRVADGAAGYYMGVPPWVERGFLGIARIGGKSSVSRFEGHTVAHEFGHNLSLLHAPCGGPAGVDPYYPHRGGVIGVWGYDFRNGSMVDPELHTDLMTYCRTFDWISDYSFAKAADYRRETGASRAMASLDIRTSGQVLIVRGGRRAGRLRLDPSFVLDAPPTLPDAPGPYRLSGTDASGRELFSLRIAMAEIADVEEDAASFVFAIPAPDAWAGALDRITLTGPEGTTELGRDGAIPERLVLDADSGRIRAILRGEEALADAAADGRADQPARTLLSRGIPDAAAWRR